MNNIQKAVTKIQEALKAGRVLRAYNQLDHQETTVGQYIEAVDRGFRFAVIGYGYKASQVEFRTIQEAAYSFVCRVGAARAVGAIRG